MVAVDHCAHGHHHHDEDADSPTENLAYDCGHEHDGGGNHGCDEGDCSFTSTQRSNDVEWLLAFSMWCQTVGEVADANATDSLLLLHSAAETPPDPLMDAGSTRAMSQVWRL